MGEVRELICAPERQGSLLVERLPSGRLRWWTFARGAVNSTLALKLGGEDRILVDDLWVETAPGLSLDTALGAQLDPKRAPHLAASGPRDHELKFSACLPAGLIASTINSRTLDDENLERLTARV